MKWSTFLQIVGGAVVIGVVAYSIYKHLWHQGNDTAESTDDSAANYNDIAVLDDANDDDSRRETSAAGAEQTEQYVLETIKERHQEAARQLKETLGKMEEDSSKYEEKISKSKDDLDDLQR